MRLILATFILILLTACAERIDNAPQPGDVIHLPPIEWRVVDQPTLEAVYRASGMEIGEKQNLHGFAGTRDGHAVIYTLAPRSVDDSVTRTVGHEVMHIALGEYHK